MIIGIQVGDKFYLGKQDRFGVYGFNDVYIPPNTDYSIVRERRKKKRGKKRDRTKN